MSAILHGWAGLLATVYLSLLVLNAVTIVVVNTAQRHNWAKRLLQTFLVLNTPVVLFLILKFAAAAHADAGHHGGEGGQYTALVFVISLPLLAEFLLLLTAWSRLRAHPQ